MTGGGVSCEPEEVWHAPRGRINSSVVEKYFMELHLLVSFGPLVGLAELYIDGIIVHQKQGISFQYLVQTEGCACNS